MVARLKSDEQLASERERFDSILDEFELRYPFLRGVKSSEDLKLLSPQDYSYEIVPT